MKHKTSRTLRLATWWLGVGFMLAAPGIASAHTVEICWRDQNGVTTFYAGTYHSPSEGPSPIGGIIIDGFTYPFTGYILPAQRPADASCFRQPGAPGVVHYQSFTSAFQPAAHTISFTATNAVQAPWAPFPLLVFGGAACADADFDGICNDVDPCPLDPADDGDGDGFCANVDNCPNDANASQVDSNHNGHGDACEGAICGNGAVEGSEQCDDGNAAGGDGCSAICTREVTDADADGVSDNSDNCPTAANASQADADGDGRGDACDPDDDNDGVLDASDNCTLQSNGDQADHDGDGQGDACDGDDDNDGVGDGGDNCAFVANAGQANLDGDALGDVCDPDDDNDGVADGGDVCPATAPGMHVEPATGCALSQLCPCEMPRGSSVRWKNHGGYVSCVAQSSTTLVHLGVMTQAEKDAAVSVAGASSCGK